MILLCELQIGYERPNSKAWLPLIDNQKKKNTNPNKEERERERNGEVKANRSVYDGE